MGSAGAMAMVPLWADAKTRFILYSLILVVTLLVGFILIAWLDRWRKRPASDGLSAGDQLAHFRRLYDAGALSKEEFEQIRAKLAEKLRQELKLTAPSAPSPPSAAPKPNGDGFRPGNGQPPTDGIRPPDKP